MDSNNPSSSSCVFASLPPLSPNLVASIGPPGLPGGMEYTGTCSLYKPLKGANPTGGLENCKFVWSLLPKQPRIKG